LTRPRTADHDDPGGHAPSAIAIGGGNVWVANGDGTLMRIDPRTTSPRR
jgi:hypothetical protein